jgi:hypothetical protein
MTSTRVLSRLDVATSQTENSSLAIPFRIKDELLMKLRIIQLRDDLPLFSNNQIVSIEEMQAAFVEMNDLLANANISDEDKIALEKYKIRIIKSCLNYFNTLDSPLVKKEEIINEKPSDLVRWFKIGVIVVVSFIGMIEGAIGGFLGFNQLLLDLMPQISQPWLIALTVGITAVNLILFLGFEVVMLKNMFGVKTQDNASRVIEEHNTNIDLVNKMNVSLSNANVITQLTRTHYKQLTSFATQLNDEVQAKKTLYHKYKKHPVKKILEWVVTFFGAISFALGSYFGAASLLTLLAAPLVGTPIGWAIIGALVGSGVVFYFSMRGTGMTTLLNPSFEAFNHVKEKLASFTVKGESDFNKILMNRNIFKADKLSTEKVSRNERLVNQLDLDISVNDRKPKNNISFFQKRCKEKAAEKVEYKFSRSL